MIPSVAERVKYLRARDRRARSVKIDFIDLIAAKDVDFAVDRGHGRAGARFEHGGKFGPAIFFEIVPLDAL